ncbi:MAG: OmpW family outer membrane protein [Gemmatimonadota bacterium]|jgi:outer membrane protein W
MRADYPLVLRLVLPVLLALGLLPGPGAAQAPDDSQGPWTLRIRAVISGTSHDSEPEGWTIYSGIGLEAAVARRLGDMAALESSLRTESREVEATGEVPSHLGSLEVLPLTLLVQWWPRAGGEAEVQPYLGAGLAPTATWEKTGALDSTDVRPSLDPAVQAGLDWGLSRRTALNLDVKWNPFTARIRDFATPDPSVSVDPMTFGLGLGVRF